MLNTSPSLIAQAMQLFDYFLSSTKHQPHLSKHSARVYHQKVCQHVSLVPLLLMSLTKLITSNVDKHIKQFQIKQLFLSIRKSTEGLIKKLAKNLSITTTSVLLTFCMQTTDHFFLIQEISTACIDICGLSDAFYGVECLRASDCMFRHET